MAWDWTFVQNLVLFPALEEGLPWKMHKKKKRKKTTMKKKNNNNIQHYLLLIKILFIELTYCLDVTSVSLDMSLCFSGVCYFCLLTYPLSSHIFMAGSQTGQFLHLLI